MKKEKLTTKEFSPKEARHKAYFNLGLAAINLSYGSEHRSAMFASIIHGLRDDPQRMLSNSNNLENYLSKRRKNWDVDFQGLGFERVNSMANQEKYCEIRADILETYILRSEHFLRKAEEKTDIADIFFTSKGVENLEIPSDRLLGEWQKMERTDPELMSVIEEVDHVIETLRATRRMVLIDATMMIATGQTVKREFGPECDPLASIFYQAWSTFLNRREYQG